MSVVAGRWLAVGASRSLPTPLLSAAAVANPSSFRGEQPQREYWGKQNLPVPRHRRRPNKHWPEDFRKYRAAKVLKIDLPDADFQRKLQVDEVS